MANKRQMKKKTKSIQANQSYENYVERYNTRKRNLAKQEIRMDMRKYTKEEWKRQYTLAKEENPSAADINAILVDRGTYKRGERQAAALKKALGITGVEVSRREIMLGQTFRIEEELDRLDEAMIQANYDLLEQGYSGKQRKMIIGAQFFGSK